MQQLNSSFTINSIFYFMQYYVTLLEEFFYLDGRVGHINLL